MKGQLNRRAFLGSSAVLAGLSMGSGRAGRTAPGALRLGVATYSLRKFSRPEAIEMLQQIGVSYVSIKSFHLPYESPPEELRNGRQEFVAAGLEILSGGNISLQRPAELRPMFEYARNSGLPMMVCAPTHETLDEVEKLVKEFDIRIAIHNHGPEDIHFPTPESALDALQGRDGRMGLCIDLGHTARTGTNVLDSIRRAGPKLFDVHIKDLGNLLDGASQCAVGEGAMPVVGIFRELKAANYQGGVMLEYEIHPDSPVSGMIRSVSYMRGVLDGLAG